MPMVVTDPTVSGNPIAYVNQAFIDLFGYSRKLVMGQNYFFLTSPEPDPEVERHIWAAMLADGPLNLEVHFGPKAVGSSGRHNSSALSTMPRTG